MDFFTDLVQTILDAPKALSDPDRWGPPWQRHQLQHYIQGIYDLCVQTSPTQTLDIGTGHGVSCLALAYALKILGLPMNTLTTLGLGLSSWRKVPRMAGEMLDRHGLDIEPVRAVVANFLDLDSHDFFSPKDRVMVFYDIHDNPRKEWYMAEKFLAEWAPRISEGLVAMHDTGLIKPGHKPSAKIQTRYSYSRAEHWSGKTFAGFGEVAVFVEWLNEHHGQITAIPQTSIAYFRVRNGKPL